MDALAKVAEAAFSVVAYSVEEVALLASMSLVVRVPLGLRLKMF